MDTHTDYRLTLKSVEFFTYTGPTTVTTIFKNENLIIQQALATERDGNHKIVLVAKCTQCELPYLFVRHEGRSMWACVAADGCGKICGTTSDTHSITSRANHSEFVRLSDAGSVSALRRWISMWLDIHTSSVSLEVL